MNGLPTLGHTPTDDTIPLTSQSPLSDHTLNHTTPASHIPKDSHTETPNQISIVSHTLEDTHMPTLGTTPTSEHTPNTPSHISPPTPNTSSHSHISPSTSHTSSTPPSSKQPPPAADHTPPSTSHIPSLKGKATGGTKTEKKVSDFLSFSLLLGYLSLCISNFLLLSPLIVLSNSFSINFLLSPPILPSYTFFLPHYLFVSYCFICHIPPFLIPLPSFPLVPATYLLPSFAL